jgi:hypothetical protein
MANRFTGIYVDPLGFLHIDGVRICKVVIENGQHFFEFYDKDRRRSSCRGSCYVRVDPTKLMKELQNNKKRKEGGE